MPSGPRRVWNGVPQDSALGPATYDFLTWLMTVANQVQGSLFPPAAPMVTTISHPNAVQVAWNEVVNAASYAVFETSTNQVPAGVPLTTVPANLGGSSNSFMRASLNDTVTRFYWVQAIDKNGDRSAVSAPAPGAALAGGATVIPISQTPVNQGGVGGGVGGGGGIFGRGGNVNRLS
jgi:hypothetical protein